MIKKGIEHLKKYGLKDTVNKVIFKFLKKTLNVYFSKLNRIKRIDHNNKFKKIKIDTTNFNTDLCEIGKKYNTDKSPYHSKHRHAYTGIYHFLFHQVKNENLNIAELGCFKNEGMKMFREYFKNANLFGYDIDQKHINNAKNDNLINTKYFLMDVNNSSSIKEGLSKSTEKFDIIIDDSSHIFEHQINIVKNCIPFLKKNAYLIIEDIYNKREIHKEENYYKELNDLKNEFSEIYFIQSEHLNRFSPMYNNDKLLVLIKS
mgnify:FL=1